MKNLKNYVKNYVKDYINENYLHESIWDVEDNIENDNNEFVIDEIRQFIKDNYYKNVNLKCLDCVFDNEKNKYVVSYTREVSEIKLRSEAKSIANDLFEWDLIDGWFDCSGCDNLTILKGAPKEVRGSFECHNCPKLDSLQGAPEYVGENFNCSYCPKLTTLEGAPKEVWGDFNCYSCSELKSLKGAPKRVDGDFDCQWCPNLHSLNGIGKVRGRIDSNIIDSNISSK